MIESCRDNRRLLEGSILLCIRIVGGCHHAFCFADAEYLLKVLAENSIQNIKEHFKISQVNVST